MSREAQNFCCRISAAFSVIENFYLIRAMQNELFFFCDGYICESQLRKLLSFGLTIRSCHEISAEFVTDFEGACTHLVSPYSLKYS